MDRTTLTLVLAGGSGRRLSPLTRYRAKPAVRFAGIARLVDFPLANCLNSGLSCVLALTENHAEGMHRYLTAAWQPAFEQSHGGFLEAVAAIPQSEQVGTAAAVRQHLPLIEDVDPELVLILSGDQVSYIDYRPLLAFHRAHGGAATLACLRVPVADAAHRWGAVDVDNQYRVVAFEEPHALPRPLCDDAHHCLASMGVYLFSRSMLSEILQRLPNAYDGGLDFERSVLPRLVETNHVYAYEFTAAATGGSPYWRDVGTLEAYYQAQRDLLAPTSPIEIDDPRWPLLPDQEVTLAPGLRRETSFAGDEPNLIATDALVCGQVSRSIIGPDCIVEAGAVVEDSILTHGVVVEEGALVTHTILDEHVHVVAGAEVGVDTEIDAARGLVVTPRQIVAAPAFHMIAALPRPHRGMQVAIHSGKEPVGLKSLW